MASPDARYLEICSGKHSSHGRRLLTLSEGEGDSGPLLTKQFSGILMSDGAAELSKLAADTGVLLANCMSHARRQIIKAGNEYPAKRDVALDFIGELYAIEKKRCFQMRPPRLAHFGRLSTWLSWLICEIQKLAL
ncbi:MAG: transposase [Deltaproteobacteria bacterium]|nr:transposase [Deltaproteobacteria bacterium]